MINCNLFLFLFLFTIGCTSVKDVKSTSGPITVGSHNIVINFPNDQKNYSKDEINSNISVLQNVISNLNAEIGQNTQQDNKVKDNKKQPSNSPSTIPKELNDLKENRDKAFEALKAWENLYNPSGYIYMDNKSRLVSQYKIRADSLEQEKKRLELQNQELLSEILNKGVESGKFDSLLASMIIKPTGSFPKGTTFVEELDSYSYERMLTLRGGQIEKLTKNIKPTQIKIKNLGNSKVYCAVRYFALDDQWVTEGWYSAEPNEYTSMTFYTSKNYVYINAHWSDGRYTMWGIGTQYGGKKFPAVTDNAFTLLETYKNTGVKTSDYYFSQISADLGRTTELNTIKN